MNSIKLPKFTLVEKLSSTDAISNCDRCGREIKHSYLIRNNETGETNSYGSGCAHKVMGISITEMVEENIAYEREVEKQAREAEMEAMGKTYIQAFEEADPEMLKFIAEGAEENDFLADMKKRIEESGSLTDGQYQAVWRMMLPFADLEKGTKVDMKVYPLKVDVTEGMYGRQYMVTAVTENMEKVRIFFSRMDDEKDRILINAKVWGFDKNWNTFGRPYNGLDNPIYVKGTFDGYKIKRAKISKGA
jgi:hypothetical protein